MQRYGNLNGHAGVVAYELGEGSITVRFAGEGEVCYLYNSERPGPDAVREMQRLARAGQGLTTYISQHVRDNYAKRW